jgi:hypothetical protein
LIGDWKVYFGPVQALLWRPQKYMQTLFNIKLSSKEYSFSALSVSIFINF